MGGAFTIAPVPVVKPPTKPKRPRKPEDYTRLITPRTGRFTPSFWILKEGTMQDVRHERASGSKATGVHYEWERERRLYWLCKKGWLEERTGPRGGEVFRTTGDGAFM